MAMGIAMIIAFLTILFTGEYPRSLFDFVTGVNRWSYRVNAYALFLTDAYPPFTLAPVTPDDAALPPGHSVRPLPPTSSPMAI